jgi:AraC family transcriptional regulator
MSLMQAQRHEEKYLNSTLLKSSKDLGWSTLFAELRSYNRYEGPGGPAPTDAEVGIVVRGSDEPVTYKVGGSWQSTRPTTGSIWLRPIGRTSDEVRVGSANFQALHLYMSSVVFARLKDDYNLRAVPGHSIRYFCGVRDEVINQIGLSVLSEVMSPTAAGRMLVETSSLLLAAASALTLRDRAYPAAHAVPASAG